MKTWKIATVAAGALILAGCGNKAVDNSTGSSPQPKPVASSESQGGIISSIKDAMGLGKMMECTYTVKDGMGPGQDIVSKAFVQGEKYKSENVTDSKKTISLFDGKAIYSWTEGEKTGTKMEKSCLDDLSKSTPEEKTGAEAPLDDNISQEEAFKDAMDVKCEDASGVDFNAPSDITWTDQCQAMKEMMEKLKDINIPQGNIPNAPNTNISL